MKEIVEDILELHSMKSYPEKIFYNGNLELLQKKKVSIIGSRKPSKYSREMIHRLSSSLSKSGVCIVSGGAMGIDAIAHNGAGVHNTIAVLPCGLDIKYPSVNKNLLRDIEENGLLISQFEDGFKARPWSFVVRNEVVVALGDILIVGEAELDSGSMRSIEFALKMNKEIYVLPQRLGESSATNKLLTNREATAIYDIDTFVENISGVKERSIVLDEFQEYCKTKPSYEEALLKFPDRVFEAELQGDIKIINGYILVGNLDNR